MPLDFSDIALRNRAFSEKPMTFVDQAPKNFLSAIIDLIAIETGNRIARQHWQKKQVQNLLQHATQKSAFWRKRIGANEINHFDLSDLPILTRHEVANQVETEGSLLLGGPIPPKKHSTSGSSGIPVQFFQSEMNSSFNVVRYAAQYFMETRDLTLSRTRVRLATTPDKHGFTTVKNEAWPEPLGPLIRTGAYKYIEYFRPDMNSLCEELQRDPIGYLITRPDFAESILQYIEPNDFKRVGTAMMIPVGGEVSPELRQSFSSVGIPVRANYSSEEVGPIGFECEMVPGCYHIATSNVIIEVIPDENFQLRGQRAGRVLVTHLHSYATPFIRYDVGDLATLNRSCSCGYGGPVLSNICGRSKALIKHADGRVSQFHVRGKELTAVASFDEYRIRQTDIKNIIVEIGGRDSLNPDEVSALVKLVKRHAGDEFEVAVKAVAQIDWGHSTKRLGFRSDVLS
jgi:phenylacetate-coenzyme A ligase PaaK-like adenylate-forming protein